MSEKVQWGTMPQTLRSTTLVHRSHWVRDANGFPSQLPTIDVERLAIKVVPRMKAIEPLPNTSARACSPRTPTLCQIHPLLCLRHSTASACRRRATQIDTGPFRNSQHIEQEMAAIGKKLGNRWLTAGTRSSRVIGTGSPPDAEMCNTTR